MIAVKLDKITKSYDGIHKALDDISFSIPRGEIFGFLGPNGSGKTTTVRLLNGILAPTSGKTHILEREVSGSVVEIHRLCGVMTESASCYENLSAEDNLLFFGRMHGLEERELKSRVEAILKKLELYDVRGRKVKTYSTGMRKRVSLAVALVHNPKVLFLDEPTSGLDPENALTVTKLIKELADENEVTIFLCTHQLKYAEDICTLYGFIDRGKMLGFGTFEELAARKNAKTMLKLRGDKIPVQLGLEVEDKGIYKKSVSGDEEAAQLIESIVKNGGRVFEASREKWSLEQLYFSYIRSKGDGEDE